MANYTQIDSDIMAAFRTLMKDHEFDDISVSDIAKKAQITRRAFYNHFKDKYNLVNRILENDIFPYVLNVTNLNEWDKGSLFICDYLKENRDYYRKIITLQRQNCLEEQFHRLTEAQMDRLIPQALYGRQISNEDKAFLTEYYYQAYMGLVQKWVMGSYDFTSEEFVERWRSLLENSLHNFLRDFGNPITR